jgi:hypothetical protein
VIYLDDLALQVSSSITTSFDLYFGTNAIPGGNEFQGSTASNAWNVASLNPDTTYFWKVVARRGAAMVSGPVWQFRTAPALPVCHFAWSAIATQQYVGYPFFVSLAAQSAVSNVVADFNQPVTISGSLTTGQRQLFLQNFEDGNSTGWNSDEGQGAYSQSVTTQTAAMGRYSLSLIGGNRQHLDGLRYVFSRFVMRPDEIRFSVRASETNKAGGFFGVGNDSGASGLGALFYMGPSGRMGVFEENAGFRGTNYVANQWYHVSLLFDWVRKRIACAVDGQTIATNFPFHFTFLEDVVSLHLYNFDNTQAWWDEIELVEGNRVVPIVIAPTGISNFADGAWTGPITVAEPGQNISLAAMDGMGRFGVSPLFNVDANTDSDGDGLPDAWELRYFGSLNGNASDDPDHDGLTDLQEFRAGTLPNDASSALRISGVELNGGLVWFRFNSIAGKMYQLERATGVDDGAWELVGNPVIGDGSTLHFSDRNDVNLPGRFYRIHLVP